MLVALNFGSKLQGGHYSVAGSVALASVIPRRPTGWKALAVIPRFVLKRAYSGVCLAVPGASGFFQGH